MDEDSFRARVRLIKAGVSKNGNWYTEGVLQEATPMFEGVPSFVDHKELKDRSARDKVGDFTGAVFEGDAAYADFNVYPGTGKWLWENMKAAPHSVQLSIKARGLSEKIKHPETGQTVNRVSKLTAVESVDVVALAAAGGGVVNILKEDYKEANPMPETVTVDDLKMVDKLRSDFRGEVERENELKKFSEMRTSLAKAGFEDVDSVLMKLAEAQDEIKGLKAQVGQYELEKKIREHEALVQKCLKGSELKEEYADGNFVESLRALPDEEKIKEAIKSRKDLIHAVEAKVRGNGPEPEKSTEPVAESELPTDDEIIAKLKRN